MVYPGGKGWLRCMAAATHSSIIGSGGLGSSFPESRGRFLGSQCSGEIFILMSC